MSQYKIVCLEERLKKLEVELAEARKDTERFNWLEKPSNRGLLDLYNCMSGSAGLWAIGVYDDNDPFKTECASARAAIDAAMKDRP